MLLAINRVLGADKGVIDFQVNGTMPTIKQPKDMDCWVATAAMMKEWKDKASYEIEAVLDNAGPQYKAMFNGNTGLSLDLSENFLRASA